jgi:hypothetical protein
MHFSKIFGLENSYNKSLQTSRGEKVCIQTNKSLKDIFEKSLKYYFFRINLMQDFTFELIEYLFKYFYSLSFKNISFKIID